ncbi:P-loop containing nucleoside triphosphate hydrolase protein [Syncephalis plumigaleata]|nr:P-loop containing nucleoside triphosphate hydrolase protein [Syncephalis plumigaleata]
MKTNDGRLVSLEDSASFIDHLTFNWVSPLMAAGYHHQLNDEDLWSLRNTDRAQHLTGIYYGHYRKQSVLTSVIYTCWSDVLKMIIYGALWGVSMYGPPYFLNRILEYINDPASEIDYLAWYYVFGMFASLVFISVVLQQAMFAGWRAQLRIHAMLSSQIFRKCLARQNIATTNEHNGSATQEDQSNNNNNNDNDDDEDNDDDDDTNKPIDWNTGTVTNVLNSDVANIGFAFSFGQLFVGSAVQIFVAVFFLWQLIGWATFIGALSIIPVYWGSSLVSKWLAKSIAAYIRATDIRLGIVNEMLQSIRMIKLFAWETRFQQRIHESRLAEVARLKERLLGFSLFIVVTHGSPAVMLCCTLGAYVWILGNPLTAPMVFTTVAVFNTLRSAVEQLPELLFWVILCRTSLARIQGFLDQPDVSIKLEDHANHNEMGASVARIAFVDAEFSWCSEDDTTTSINIPNEGQPTRNTVFKLVDLNVEFIPYELNIIAGPTGSGKTSMLMALLGEMPCKRGQAILPLYGVNPVDLRMQGQVAYVAQQAWLQSRSIRDNILFGEEYDETRYKQVIFACALERDLEILDAGDRTEIGEKGVTLSGGQKQRVALARAIYSSAKHILLDDCLSAVDAHTAKHIVEHCLQGPLIQGRTRILVTHHVELCAPLASFMLVMERGRIVAQGAAMDIVDTVIRLDKDAAPSDDKIACDTAHDGIITTTINNNGDGDSDSDDDDNDGRLVEEETRQQGSVKLRVYHYYIQASGGYLWWLGIIGIIVVMQLVIASQVYWLRIWTNDAQDNRHINYYFGVYILLSILVLVAIGIRHTIPLMATLRASRTIHETFVFKLSHAVVRFYDKTPIGRILNRFTKDTSTLDRTLPIALGFLVVNIVEVLFVIVIICTISPVFLLYCIAIGILYAAIGVYSIRSSCELKRLESVSKSPFLALVTETLLGVTTIRAFGATNRFLNDCFTKVDTMNRPSYLLCATNRWMAYRSDVLSAIITTLCCVFLLLNHDVLDAGFMGFILTYALMFSEASVWIIRNANYLELAMNGLERILEYIGVEQERPAIIENNRPDPNWPSRGAITVENLVLRYAVDQSPVIHDLSFDVKPGERIGIVGRTGAGKSSLALAFFRFIEASGGRITIDGVDISQIGLQDLRSRLTIIPQDPVLFAGTIRSNLDPFLMYDDASIWNALRRSHLIDHHDTGGDDDNNNNGNETTSRPVGIEHLDAPIAEAGGNFSQGQRQLLAMARALLRNSRVIVMDEATASVDFDTDQRIQQTVREEFTQATLICIAHRLRTIIDYDRVLVLDAGRLVEYDKPSVLLHQSNSLFRQLCAHSGELDTLLTMTRSSA